MADIVQIDSKTWRLEDDFVRFFLLEGDQNAVLIDSGVNCPNAFDLAKTLTDKPILLLNTHGDGDHVSGTAGFDRIYMHPADFSGCGVDRRFPGVTLRPVADGETIDLGGRPLQIIHIPGHTAGSIAILDVANRVLYAGDSVQKGSIYMFGPQRTPDRYAASLDKLTALCAQYDTIYASHDEPEVPGDYAAKVKEAWLSVQSGSVPFENIDLFGNRIKSYTTTTCGFYLP